MHLKRAIGTWCALAAIAASPAARNPANALAQAPPSNPSRSADDKRACINNLKLIYTAIEAYQKDQHDLPKWLSDLVPKYLEDPNVLICPVSRRTGETEASPLVDAKLPCSYLFEFSPVPLGDLLPIAPKRTRREWKRRQMGLVGSEVPVVRCRFHHPVLNLAFDGRVYESPLSWWLLFTNRVDPAALTPPRLFADVRPATAGGKKKAAVKPHFVARNRAARKQLLDLTPFYNANLNGSWNETRGYGLGAVPTGVQNFGSVEFDVRGIVQLGSKSPLALGFPVSVKDIPVGQHCQRLYFLHAAAFAGPAEEGKAIGSYVIRFAGGQPSVKIPIRYGQEVRECHAGPDEPEAPAELVVAWRGKDTGKNGSRRFPRLFLTTWNNPRPEQEVESIDFISGVATAAPFLVAITVE